MDFGDWMVDLIEESVDVPPNKLNGLLRLRPWRIAASARASLSNFR